MTAGDAFRSSPLSSSRPFSEIKVCENGVSHEQMRARKTELVVGKMIDAWNASFVGVELEKLTKCCASTPSQGTHSLYHPTHTRTNLELLLQFSRSCTSQIPIVHTQTRINKQPPTTQTHTHLFFHLTYAHTFNPLSRPLKFAQQSHQIVYTHI